MIWIGVEYTDGTRTYHAFTEALLYVVNGRVHVNGNALCGCVFTADRSGARRDVVCALLNGNAAGETRCEGCVAAEGN